MEIGFAKLKTYRILKKKLKFNAFDVDVIFVMFSFENLSILKYFKKLLKFKILYAEIIRPLARIY